MTTLKITNELYVEFYSEFFGYKPQALPENRLQLVSQVHWINNLLTERKMAALKVEADRKARLRQRASERRVRANTWFSRLLQEAK